MTSGRTCKRSLLIRVRSSASASLVPTLTTTPTRPRTPSSISSRRVTSRCRRRLSWNCGTSRSYRDIHGAAATDVLTVRDHYTVEDPYKRDETSDSRPTFGLDDGETDGIVLANALAVDGFLTDEFGGTNFALVHAALRGPRIVPAPRLLCDYVRNGHMTAEEARRLITTISPHRSWGNSPYVAQLLAQLE